ncbi:MAG: Fe-S cluster assembly protein SufD [Alphaproteobacteria bacterium]|nr:Fe-S cluster assembly protein SufD [Alphaproteobacteria bacterium]
MAQAAVQTFKTAADGVHADALPWLTPAKALADDAAPAWIRALRETGAASFATTGLPTLAWEGWQYTNLRPMTSEAFHFDGVQGNVTAADLPAPLLGDSHRIVLVNGRLRPDLGTALPDGVKLLPLMEAQEPEEELVTVGNLATSPLLALNCAYMRDGFILDIAPHRDIARPVEILFMTAGDAPAVYPRVLYRFGENSGATLLERHAGAGASLTNLYAGIVLKQAARGRYYRFIDENDAALHVSQTVVRSHKSSDFQGFSSVSGLATGRQEFGLELLDDGISSSIGGIYMLKGRQCHDFTILADHFEKDGTSVQHFKGVIDDQARAIFQGKIHVHRPAQKTDGYQSHHALLLSDQAEASAKPELEIYADDVKCSHGATAGMLDNDALFYLQSRGIPAAQAKALLIRSFLCETLEKITRDDVRALYAARIAEWLGATEEAGTE